MVRKGWSVRIRHLQDEVVSDGQPCEHCASTMTLVWCHSYCFWKPLSLLCHKVFFYLFFYLVLLLVWVTWGGREFHVVMALFNTVHFPASALDLGTVKTPLVAFLVWYQWVSERCANCLNRQFCTINTSHKANSDAVNFSSTLTCMLTFALRVH